LNNVAFENFKLTYASPIAGCKNNRLFT